MARREDSGSNIEPGVVARVAAGIRYAFTGRGPDWFGPQQPQQAQAPDSVAGRRFDFPVGFNLRSQPRQDEGITFGQLRALADNYDLLRLVIETRKDQLSKMRWAIKPRDAEKKPDDRCKQAEEFFALPDREHGWDEWLRMLLEDLMVIDAPTIYPRKTKGGALYALEPMDGATIKRVLDNGGRTPLPPEAAYQQVLKGLPAVNYTREELIYRPRNLRTHKVYGLSPVEQVVMTVNIALRRQLHQLEYYRSGSVPDALAGVPADWQPDQIKQFQDYWDLLMEGDSAAKRRLKFVPGELAKNFKETKQPPLKDLYDEWLARVICFAFSIEPTPFIAQVNRATAETAREQSLAEGLAPLQNWIKGLVDYVLAAYMEMPDLEFAWAEEDAVDPLVQAQINVMYVNSGVLSVNEVRSGLGLEAIEEPVPVEPVNETSDGKKPENETGEGKPEDDKDAAYMGGVLRKQRPKALRLINRNRAVVIKARKKLSGLTKRFLKQQAGKIAEQLVQSLELEKSSQGGGRKVSPRVAEALDGLDFGDWSELADLSVGVLTDVTVDGGLEALKQIGMLDDDLEEKLRERAGLWARDRSAEMVGMKWVDDELVPNPDARWQITEGTRDMLRGMTERALDEGWSADQMAAEIEASYPFSEARAEMIARTEIAKADVAGTMEGYRASGVVTMKRWLTAQDDLVSDECAACGEVGAIGIDDTFPGGADAPPNHPNCRCAVIPVLDDEQPVLLDTPNE